MRMVRTLQDPGLVDLVDSLVAAVDSERIDEIDRLREALEPFGATALFNEELRLNGRSDHEGEWCECHEFIKFETGVAA